MDLAFLLRPSVKVVPKVVDHNFSRNGREHLDDKFSRPHHTGKVSDLALDTHPLRHRATLPRVVRRVGLAAETPAGMMQDMTLVDLDRPNRPMLAGIRNRGYSVKFTGENRA